MVKIELSDADALVLFEFLARHDDIDDKLPEGERLTELHIADRSELYSLWQVHGALECTLVEPFSSDYDELVEDARRSVRVRWDGC
ncbi:hypothetical protein [Microbulbifer yueqingensis]|nr:hypothetical protein [Microbulbifer yueqingensis]